MSQAVSFVPRMPLASVSLAATMTCFNDQSKPQGPLSFSPDLFVEDECDASPRPFSTPLQLDCSVDRTIAVAVVELVHAHNRALFCHHDHQLGEASQVYQIVSASVQNLLSSLPTSANILEVGMRASNNYATIAYSQGNVSAAISSVETSLGLSRQLVDMTGAFYLEYVSILSNWCHMTYKSCGISPALLEGMQEILRLRTCLLPWDHEDVAAAHFNLGVTLYGANDRVPAKTHLETYLKILEHRSKHDLDNRESISALTYLLLLENEDKDSQMNQDLVRGLRALQDKRHEQGLKHPEIPSILNYIGTLLFHQQELKKALAFFQEELRLERKMIEYQKDISVSVTCNNIGRILQELGHFKEAVKYYKQALHAETMGSNFGPSRLIPKPASNLFSTVWYNLGIIYDKLGEYHLAIDSFSKSLELRKLMLGENHPDIACLYYNIGVLQMEQDHLSDAYDSFKMAIGIRNHGDGSQLNDARVIKTLDKLASLYKAKGQIARAIQTSYDILRVLESSNDFDEARRLRQSGILLRSVSELYHSRGDLALALEEAKKSVSNFDRLAVMMQNDEASFSEVFEQLTSSLVLVGSFYHELGEPLKARSTLCHAITMLDEGMVTHLTAPAKLHILGEVSSMLAHKHCAPQA